MNHFKGKQFQKDVIIVAVGYYLRYNLSYRDVQEILYNRGINVSHTTVYRWVQEYGKLLYNIWKRKNKQSIDSWKMDETYIKSKENGIIFIAPLMQMVSLWIYGYGKSEIHKQLTPFSRD